MLTSSNIEHILRNLKPILSEKYEVERIGYFGSYARGEQTKDSDVDILVEFRRPLGWALQSILRGYSFVNGQDY